jgi:VanZ family protein
MKPSQPTTAHRPRYLAVIWLWLPVVSWMGVIFYLSAQPSLPSFHEHWMDVVLERGGHLGVYAVLALLLWRVTRRGRWNWWVAAVIAFACAVLYGASDEFHQGFVPGRTPDALDLTVDAVGAGVTLGAAAWMWHRRRAKR